MNHTNLSLATDITTSFQYSFLLYSRSYILPYIPYNAAIGICVLLFDFTVASFYFSRLRDRSFVPGMYLVMALFDGVMVMGLYCQFVVLAVLYRTELQGTGSLWALLVSKVGIEVCYKVSVFANTLLCVARTLQTARPFKVINKRLALTFLVGYFLFWVFMGLSETILFAKHFLDISEVDPYVSFGRVGGNICHNIVWGCDRAGTHCTQGLACTFILTLLLPLLVPCILTITCLFLMVFYMRKPYPASTSAKRQRTVTITVTWLTLIFVICISPSVLYYFVYVFIMLGLLGYNHNQGTPTHDFIMENLCSTTLPLLNALLTQAVIVYRSRDLKSNLITRYSRYSGRSRAVRTKIYRSLSRSNCKTTDQIL